VETLERFTLAEDYHQKYELRSTPVLGDELVDVYGPAVVDSTVAARLNGFVAGHGSEAQRSELLASVSLSPGALSELERRL
jgi:peptide-methionine (S)-S-oxide reductase